ncbi:MAG: hypothetical protein J6C96_03850 [Oscillospiraceae bacterium]|nr:hypothetical protein [Oscillospiraceae bacterium]
MRFTCGDNMIRADVLLEFTDDDFTDDKISAESALSRAVTACGFSGYAFSGGADMIYKITDLPRENVENKTARDILEMFSTAMCGYWFCESKKIYFIPFGSYYSAMYSSTIRYSEIKYGGEKKYTKLIMYNGDKIYTAGDGGARDTLMISTPLASQKLCDVICARISDFTYKAWSCEKGFIKQYIYPGEISFTPELMLICTRVDMYMSSVGVFFSASSAPVSESDYAYQSQVQRQLNRKLELERRNGNTAYGKNGIKVFQNKNKNDTESKKAIVVTAFKSEV